MATTRLIPIRGSRGQSVIRSLTERMDYAEYRALRDEQRELLIHWQNVESLLSDDKTEQGRRIRGER